jgi:hypothetical protein
MKKYIFSDFTPSITKNMLSFFFKKTDQHIALVEKYIHKILKTNLLNEKQKNLLKKASLLHDKSKFFQPELKPYICITWVHKLKSEGKGLDFSLEIQEKLNKAIEHHIKNNKHHPEYWSGETENLINFKDRDKSDRLIHCEKMPLLYIAEMCADWCARSEEKENSPFDWANETINKRWGFSSEQVTFIYEILNSIWDKE